MSITPSFSLYHIVTNIPIDEVFRDQVTDKALNAFSAILGTLEIDKTASFSNHLA
jgi:flagellar biosynthesis regulator FlbT